MDYYEELGLKPTASSQEIRQAYRVMARLVHPDGQADERVREMAERQMRRLNQILATLTDDQARRAYDAELALTSGSGTPVPNVNPAPGAAPLKTGRGVPPAGRRRAPNPMNPQGEPWTSQLPEWVQPAVQNWFWIALAMVLVGVGLWYVAQDKADPAGWGPAAETKVVRPREAWSDPPVDVKRAKAPTQEKTPELPSVPDRQPQAVPPEAATTPRTILPPAELPPHPAPETQEAIRPAAIPPSTATESASTPTIRERPESASGETVSGGNKPKASSFAGNWLFVPDPTEKVQPGVYPATYVEFLLADDRGQISGRYRAQYKVPDQAVSPEVAFQVEGSTPSGPSGHFRWTATDGAKGELDMTLAGPNLMKVSWWTTEFGRHARLASGTAKLIRQQTR